MKQMLQAANLFNSLVPKSHNSECQNLLFPLQIKPVKDSWSQLADILSFAPSALKG